MPPPPPPASCPLPPRPRCSPRTDRCTLAAARAFRIAGRVAGYYLNSSSNSSSRCLAATRRRTTTSRRAAPSASSAPSSLRRPPPPPPPPPASSNPRPKRIWLSPDTALSNFNNTFLLLQRTLIQACEARSERGNRINSERAHANDLKKKN